MKRITKSGRQPESFKEWKRNYREMTGQNATYKALQKEHGEYLKLKRFLITEQYYLCCYCCNRINERNSHIDHFVPQSIDGSKQLEYQNMFISCNGYVEGLSITDRETCGHRRDNWYERDYIISPLEPACETIFGFLTDGSIFSNNNDARGIKMIEKCGLNSYALKKAREAAIEVAYKNIGFYETIDDTALQREVEFNTNPNSDGELPPFCDAVSYVINQL